KIPQIWNLLIFKFFFFELRINILLKIQVGAQSTQKEMQWLGGLSLQSYSEQPDSLNDKSFTKDGLVEQISQTWDQSDYLWYTT
ncbi:hypothetical protein LB450_13635, partial [Psychroflexus sp. CAK1W]|uniref:hypothetical protein n=1 Tax=Psychroflexus curvus TaxID=2873595 RepID=UPI001CCF9E08